MSPKATVDVAGHLLRNVTLVSQFVKSCWEIWWSSWLLDVIKYSEQDYQLNEVRYLDEE